MPHYRLIGGHSRGRVVAFDDPAPPFISVPYRVGHPLDEPADPQALAFGIERYDLVIMSRQGKGEGPYPRAYVCLDDVGSGDWPADLL